MFGERFEKRVRIQDTEVVSENRKKKLLVHVCILGKEG